MISALLITALHTLHVVVLVYFVLLNGYYLVSSLLSFGALRRHARELNASDTTELIRHWGAPSVTLIVPAYNESANCLATVRSLLDLHYPDYDVLFVNDGSTDETLELIRSVYALQPAERITTSQLGRGRVRGVYRSALNPRLWVIDKENGGKADALNTGLDRCHTHLFCALDADTVLERDALLRLCRSFLEHGDTIAAGGIVRVANGSRFEDGQVREVRLPGSWLAQFQVLEYLRAFLAGRMGWSSADVLLIVSGAFGMFRRETVVSAGGYATDTVGEDMELIVRLHRHLREQRKPYLISFVPDPVAWTEVPERWRVLARQRDRWQRGLLQSLARHRVMLLNPRYGRIGMLAFPYFWFMEAFGPMIEFLGYLAFFLALATGLGSSLFVVSFLLLAIFAGMSLSIAAVGLEELTFRRYGRTRDFARLLFMSVIDSFGYRQFLALARFRGVISALRGRRTWGAMERRGVLQRAVARVLAAVALGGLLAGGATAQSGPDTLAYPARVRGEHFEVRSERGWERFYINGVNLGAALPGRFPSEFPGAAEYREWIADMAEMGANTIRVYTIHPPAFYDALAAHNERHPERPLRLLHGVWAELPPDDDYYHPEWQRSFFDEMERVVDVLHGRADLQSRPGHAAGRYRADVSRWTLGIILGREWEPYSVARFNDRYPGRNGWEGKYTQLAAATPMDAWLARAVEHVVAYETETYAAQRPVAYTNWPTLDPLRHPTELDGWRELALRGLPYDSTQVEHNEDGVGLGAVAVRPTAAFPAGWFAAYHVYPYYPDFFLHDETYNAARSPLGPSVYHGYLRALKRVLPEVPLVIAEYGVPASWGVAHFNPQGWHHGGHDEASMAEVNARLAREIAAAGAAGSILFAWIDEWFKHNWLTMPFTVPAENGRMWWDRMNPEEHYGVVAVEPVPRLGETAAERLAAWDTVPALYDERGVQLRAHADEAYLWLQLRGAGDASEWLVGFDVDGADAGERQLPGAGAPRSPVGLEHVLRIDAAGARIESAPRAQPFRVEVLPAGATRGERRTPVARPAPGMFTGSVTQQVNDGAFGAAPFGPLLAAVNRARVSVDSINHLGYGYDRGVLPEGPLPDGAWQRHGDVIEVRIPWNLLGVTDPSTRTVRVGGRTPEGELRTRAVDAIRVVVAGRDGAEWRAFPAAERAAAAFTWAGWDAPRYRTRRRATFDTMRVVFAELERGVIATAAAHSPVPAAEPPRFEGMEAHTSQPEPQPERQPAPEPKPQTEPQTDWLARANPLAWAGDYDGAVRVVDEVLAADSGAVAAWSARGRYLSWARRFEEALAAYAVAQRLAPVDTAIAHAQARVLSWAGRYAEADARYAALLARDPADAEALRGRARVASWSGALAHGEALWREAVRVDPRDAAAQLGLSQVLRWRGRPREALAAAERAAALAPEDPDVRTQLAWTRSAFAPRVGVTFAAELDSDDNQLLTMVLDARTWLTPALAVQLRGQSRRADDLRDHPLESRTASLGLRAVVADWSLEAAAGLHDRTVEAASGNGTWRASVQTPAWEVAQLTLGYARVAFDATSLLIERGIRTDEASLGAQLRLGGRVRANLGGAWTRFLGVERDNERLLARAGLDVRATKLLRLRPRVAAFRFRRDLDEGYFDPERYGHAELGIGLEGGESAWTWSAEGAPGVQQIGRSGSLEATANANARVAYSIAPGRDVSLGLVYSSLGIERLQAGSGSYRYRALVLSGGWTF